MGRASFGSLAHCFQGAFCQSLVHELHGLRASCWASLSPWWLICHCGVPSWQCVYASVHGIPRSPWHQIRRLNDEVHMDTWKLCYPESHCTRVRCVASPLPEDVGYQVAIALDPCSGFLIPCRVCCPEHLQPDPDPHPGLDGHRCSTQAAGQLSIFQFCAAPHTADISSSRMS